MVDSGNFTLGQTGLNPEKTEAKSSKFMSTAVVQDYGMQAVASSRLRI